MDDKSKLPPGLKGRLKQRFGHAGVAMFAFLGCVIAIALVGVVALLLRWPLLFPSLGPTVLLLFEKEQRPSAWPRNILIAHAIAICAGWISLWLFGLMHAPDVMAMGVTPARLGCAAFAVALTAFVKHLLKAPHPPCGATTLMVALGFFTTGFQLGVLYFGLVLLTIFSLALNRLWGVPMPVWGKPAESS
ncbi:MAG TPA: HPP family protein [Gammaproteobacteria bacterium]|jgi:CBS-domain-containing membrane protein|nr:HPP family protein [Gammaproteobacteria bacterium]